MEILSLDNNAFFMIEAMKKVFTILSIVIVSILIYQTLFSYRLVALSNKGAKKHKVYKVFFFPEPPLSIINPLKKGKLKRKLNSYCTSGEFDRYYQDEFDKNGQISNDLIYNYFSQYCSNIQTDNYDILSIKKEENNLHILLRTKKQDATIVFLLDTKTDSIIGFY